MLNEINDDVSRTKDQQHLAIEKQQWFTAKFISLSLHNSYRKDLQNFEELSKRFVPTLVFGISCEEEGSLSAENDKESTDEHDIYRFRSKTIKKMSWM